MRAGNVMNDPPPATALSAPAMADVQNRKPAIGAVTRVDDTNLRGSTYINVSGVNFLCS
jgi:hypothetical protein